MSNKCSSCGFELSGNEKICPKCGNNLETVNTTNWSTNNVGTKFCLYCGSKIDANVKFCPKCGANFETGAKGNLANNNSSNNQVPNQVVSSDDSSATTAFIFSLVGLLCCAIFAIPGLIKANECLSEIAAGRISQSKKGMATAAKVISIIALVFWVLNIIRVASGRGFQLNG